jgi:hypothetical protein
MQTSSQLNMGHFQAPFELTYASLHIGMCRSERVYSHVFRMLNEYDVMTDAMLLKPNMILPGLDAPVATPEEVARYTVRTMLRSIPPAVPGIHFLSGGMSEEESTVNLQACTPSCKPAKPVSANVPNSHPSPGERAVDWISKLIEGMGKGRVGL